MAFDATIAVTAIVVTSVIFLLQTAFRWGGIHADHGHIVEGQRRADAHLRQLEARIEQVERELFLLGQDGMAGSEILMDTEGPSNE